ncbi:sulfate adenylyltransferase subunit CysN [Phytohalomonas tamaricis]|uniref:sulfate adenylyltransferase subunit CysN n=1 Tax=Phytohalomonas tamaricis TaxID=2081032 RepID=UPI000D0BD414|nr:sulfate adenylyltransferase subunit CysN [Phytohalomonas tamaricis]
MSHSSSLIEEDIQAYLKEHEAKDLLRFITCGSVDDGKSTLIGRLLHDSKMIFEDQLAAITRDSKTRGTTGDKVDLALLVDGLQSEREQGITIDVAYRFFSTDKRKFIIADTPGHEQYTRNMATGASTASLAVILIDARYGVQVQTRRHSFICDLLGIRHLVIAVNKMDLVDFSEQRYEEIKREYLEFAEKLDADDIHFVPMSALDGDNVVNKSDHTPWYQGQPLLDLLETVEIERDKNLTDLRFPVQYVNRPNLDFRGYAGTLQAGVLKPGQQIKVLPSGKTSTVERLVTWDGDLEAAYPGQAITVTLKDEIDISRGDWLVAADDELPMSHALVADVVWMTEKPLVPGRQYDFKLATRDLTGQISNIEYGIDVNTLEHYAAEQLGLNDIGRCAVELTQSMAVDTYKRSPGTGSFIIIDRLTNITVGAGMVRSALESNGGAATVDWEAFEIELNGLVRKYFPHWQACDVRDLFNKH